MAASGNGDLEALQLGAPSTYDRASDDSSSSDESTSRKRRVADSKKMAAKRGASEITTNGTTVAVTQRRNSVSQAARDPRDEPSIKRRAVGSNALAGPPSPIIEADGLSRACKPFLIIVAFMAHLFASNRPLTPP